LKDITPFRLILVTLGLVFVFVVGLLFIGQNGLTDKPKMSLQEVSLQLGSAIPADASNVVNDSWHTRSGMIPQDSFISVTFQAPPQSALNFSKNLCQGKLDQGYDPFNATDTIEPAPKVHLIKMTRFTYYSYSPNTPEQVLGNRCWSSNGINQVRVETADINVYTVHVEQTKWDCAKFPCREMGGNYINPIPDFPFMVIGMATIDNQYVAISDETCIEMRFSYDSVGGLDVNEWAYLIGADVAVQVDNERIVISNVSDRGILLPKQSDGSTMQLVNDTYYNTCFNGNFSVGLHRMQVNIIARSSKEETYAWNFLVH
jgi:hypothetical protein